MHPDGLCRRRPLRHRPRCSVYLFSRVSPPSALVHVRVCGRLEGRLFNYDDAPPWTKDNDKILSGYRQAAPGSSPRLPPADCCFCRPGGSLWYCFKSCFKLHNESMNIWTHFAGLAFFLGITVYFFSGMRPSSLHFSARFCFPPAA